MVARFYEGGLGITLGDPVLRASKLYLKGVWYLDNSKTAASDTGTYSGTVRSLPFATLSKAITAASAGDTIIIGSGHSETIATQLTISKRLHFVGEGNPATEVRPHFTPNVAGTSVFKMTARGCSFRNLIINVPLRACGYIFDYAVTSGRGGGLHLYALKIYINAYNTDYVWSYSVGGLFDFAQVEDVTVVNSETGVTSAPYAVTDVESPWRNVTIDGGTYGVFQQTTELPQGAPSWGITLKNGASVEPTMPSQIAMESGGYVSTDAGASWGHARGLRLLGHPLLSAEGLYGADGNQFKFVSSVTGSNAAGYGESIDRPYATLAYAIATGGAANIVLLENHEETITSRIDFALQCIIGAGLGNNRPKLTRGANIVMFGGNPTFINIIFPKSTVSTSNERFDVDDVNAGFFDCRFACGDNDGGACLKLQAGASRQGSNCVINGCTFVSEATAASTAPLTGIHAIDPGTDVLTGTWVKDCVFDGGTFGWRENGIVANRKGYAIVHDAPGGVYEGISLMRNSPVSVYDAIDIFTVSEQTEDSPLEY